MFECLDSVILVAIADSVYFSEGAEPAIAGDAIIFSSVAAVAVVAAEEPGTTPSLRESFVTAVFPSAETPSPLLCFRYFLPSGPDALGVVWWCSLTPIMFLSDNTEVSMFCDEVGATVSLEQLFWRYCMSRSSLVGSDMARGVNGLQQKGEQQQGSPISETTGLSEAAEPTQLQKVKIRIKHGVHAQKP